jgi:hypothetical protein
LSATGLRGHEGLNKPDVLLRQEPDDEDDEQDEEDEDNEEGDDNEDEFSVIDKRG